MIDFPPDFDVHAVAFDQGSSQAVGIVMKLIEGNALGAHEAPTQNVILVTSDFRYFFATNVDVQSTSGLT